MAVRRETSSLSEINFYIVKVIDNTNRERIQASVTDLYLSTIS